MSVLPSNLDSTSASHQENRAAMDEHLARLDALHTAAVAGGGPRYVARHRERGKMLPRERIELLLDRDAPFLEMSAVAAAGTDWVVGASLVTGIGVVSGVECVIIASDPTAKGGAINPIGLKKGMRAYEIADHNRLPLIYLVESAGADLPNQVGHLRPGRCHVPEPHPALGERASPASVSCSATPPRVVPTCRACRTHVVMVQDRAKVFLAGPPLVKVATGEDVHRRGARRRRHACEGVGPCRSPRGRRTGRHPHRPAYRRRPRLATNSAPARPGWGRRAAVPGRSAARYPLGGSEGAVPDPRGASPGSSMGLASTSSSPATARTWSPAGDTFTAIPVGVLANDRGVSSSPRNRRRPPSSSNWRTAGTSRCSSSRTSPATW